MKKLTFSLFILPIFLMVFYTNQSYSQVYPYTVWDKTYNAPSNLQDSSVSISMNSLGMVFVTGWSLGTTTSSDIATIRYNPANGDTIWVKRFIGSLEDRVTSMTSDNNAVYITGWTFNAPPVTNRDVITIKFNAVTGDTMWVKKYNGPRGGGDYGLAITNDANFIYVCGRASDSGAVERQRYLILKYDINTGAMAPGFPYIYRGDTTNNEAHAIKVDNSGNIYITGQTSFNFQLPPYPCNVLTLKVNSAGTLVWAKTHNASGNKADNGVAIGFDNTQSNLFIAGWGEKSSYNDFIIIRYNPVTGDSTGYVSYNGPTNGTDYLVRMVMDAGNNIYITGNSQNNTLNRYEIATLKYNSSLVQQWVKRTTNADGWDVVNWITLGSNNDVYIEGSRVKAGEGYNFYTVRYDASTGEPIWTKMENAGGSTTHDFGSGIIIGDSQRVFITGSSVFVPSSTASIHTLRYSNELVGIKPISTEVPNSFNLQQNYPNPFNPATSIRFDIPKASAVNLVVYDAAGSIVEVIADNVNLPAGKYETTWDAGKYASGIYFYRIQAGSYTDTKKMIMVK
ncbi:MAG TPA: T9SS type A sorting domain-containing protein [Ignavibacteria bacterium]|nr:T9SS type A sorting domain-containing protein [Ignavibacteria bacterium]